MFAAMQPFSKSSSSSSMCLLSGLQTTIAPRLILEKICYELGDDERMRMCTDRGNTLGCSLPADRSQPGKIERGSFGVGNDVDGVIYRDRESSSREQHKRVQDAGKHFDW